MVTPAQSAEAWGPGFTGLTISLAMFGVSSGQVVLYFRSFPMDSRTLKLSILTIFILDCLHTVGFIGAIWRILVSCHRTSLDCQTSFSWGALAVLIGNYTITLFVQSFYIHRVWIISGRNKLVIGPICVAAFFQILFGLLCTGTVLKARDWQVMFNDPVYPALAAGSSSVCDALITTSVAYFLRTKRSQMHRRENYIRQLKIVFMEMGLMSCIMSALLAVTLTFQDPQARQYWAAAPAPILIKTYFNSMLAVLNARKVIRERQVEGGGLMYDLATIRNTIFDRSILLNEN